MTAQTQPTYTLASLADLNAAGYRWDHDLTALLDHDLPEPRPCSAADFVHDQTARMTWEQLRDHAEQTYGLTQREVWCLSRGELTSMMVAAEQEWDRYEQQLRDERDDRPLL